MTAYCYLHITLNKDQKLFHPCTAKFSDNSQCRIPVFDISHELPLCREHAWKRVSFTRKITKDPNDNNDYDSNYLSVINLCIFCHFLMNQDNYNRMSQEQKPKKCVKTKAKSRKEIRLSKRSKGRKEHQSLPCKMQILNTKQPIQSLNTTVSTVNVEPVIQSTTKLENNILWKHEIQTKKHEDSSQIIATRPPTVITPINKCRTDTVTMYQLSSSFPVTTTTTSKKLKLQNKLSIGGGNSIIYGHAGNINVSELNETELISASDGIGEFIICFVFLDEIFVSFYSSFFPFISMEFIEL